MKNAPQKIFDLVIIGAGPAGISIAVEAITSGISAFNSSSEAMKNICTHYLDCK